MDCGFDIGLVGFGMGSDSIGHNHLYGLSNRNCRCLKMNGFGIRGCAIGRFLKNCFGIGGCAFGRSHIRGIVPLFFYLLGMRARIREKK